jgi:hypothetical protein
MLISALVAHVIIMDAHAAHPDGEAPDQQLGAGSPRHEPPAPRVTGSGGGGDANAAADDAPQQQVSQSPAAAATDIANAAVDDAPQQQVSQPPATAATDDDDDEDDDDDDDDDDSAFSTPDDPKDAPQMGARIEVYWPDDYAWYAACVIGFVDGKHRLVYEADGEVEEIDLLEHEWRASPYLGSHVRVFQPDCNTWRTAEVRGAAFSDERSLHTLCFQDMAATSEVDLRYHMCDEPCTAAFGPWHDGSTAHPQPIAPSLLFAVAHSHAVECARCCVRPRGSHRSQAAHAALSSTLAGRWEPTEPPPPHAVNPMSAGGGLSAPHANSASRASHSAQVPAVEPLTTLATYVSSLGGAPSVLLAGWSSLKYQRGIASGREGDPYSVYVAPDGKRYRSKVEVARVLGLASDTSSHTRPTTQHKQPATNHMKPPHAASSRRLAEQLAPPNASSRGREAPGRAPRTATAGADDIHADGGGRAIAAVEGESTAAALPSTPTPFDAAAFAPSAHERYVVLPCPRRLPAGLTQRVHASSLLRVACSCVPSADVCCIACVLCMHALQVGCHTTCKLANRSRAGLAHHMARGRSA